MLRGRVNGIRCNAFILLSRLDRSGPMIGRQLHFDTLTGNHEPFPLRVLVNAELVESAGKVLHRIDIALDADQDMRDDTQTPTTNIRQVFISPLRSNRYFIPHSHSRVSLSN